MALTYKTDVVTLNAANTDFTILTASASSTLVKNITWIHDDHNTNVVLSITKSGGTKTRIGEYAATANTSTKIWTDILPLAANDILHLQSDHISGSDVGYCIISYVEDTASVAGQSIAVLTDVSISGITNGQVLEWNNSTTQFEPATVSGGASNTDGLPEGSTNLYFTDARVSANSAVAANTAKVGITTQQASAITANTAKVGITTQQASDITTNNAKVGITTTQANAITANTAKISYTDASAVAANTAKVSNVQADWNASSGLAVILNKPTLTNGTVTSVTGTAPIASTGGATPVISIAAATTSAAGSMSAADKTSLNNLTAEYEEDELKSGQNTLMNSSVSVASNKIVDIMGDALADKSNANSKKFLGFHTGSGVCVLQGMVDANNTISGASAGGPLWIGTSGAFSAAAPTTQNHYSRIVGHYIGTGQGGETLVYFNPSQDWVQID